MIFSFWYDYLFRGTQSAYHCKGKRHDTAKGKYLKTKTARLDRRYSKPKYKRNVPNVMKSSHESKFGGLRPDDIFCDTDIEFSLDEEPQQIHIPE